MATEGIGAALSIDTKIMDDLNKAQASVNAMANASEKLGRSFSQMSAGMKSIAGDISGMNLSMKFDNAGTLKSLEVLTDAVAKANERGVKSSQDADSRKVKSAQKSAEQILKEYMKAMDREVKYREKKTRMYEKLFANGDYKDATDLSNKLMSEMDKNPKNLENLRAQYRTMQQLYAEIRKMSKSPYINPALISQARSRIDEINQRIQRTQKLLRDTSGSAATFKNMVGRAFSYYAVTNFLRNLVAVRGEFEMQERSLAVIIKNASLASSMFQEIQQIAIKSPFSVMELVKQTKQMAAYRIETDKLIEKTKMLGDISAGVGVDMNRLILAYGQVKAATFLKGQELRQFSEAGVNMLGGLADRFSEIYHRAVSTGEVLKMVSKRMVKFEDVDAVLQKQTEAGGTFYRMQEIQANTLQGAITNLKDRIQIAFNEIGKSYDSVMKGVVRILETVIEKWELFSSLMIAGAAFKVFKASAGLGIRAYLKLTEAIDASTISVKNLNAAARMSGVHLSGIDGVFKKLGARMSGFVRSLGAANIVGILAAITVSVINIWKRATELRRTIERISNDIKDTYADLESRYDKLMNVASDVTASEVTRKKALEALKSEYGNILNLQDVELSNIEKINAAREEQIALIHEYAIQQGREQAMTELITKLNKTAEKRQSSIWKEEGNGLEMFIKNYKEEVKGLEFIDEDTANAARNVIERKIISGSIATAEEANKEFLKLILSQADATKAQVDKIMDSLGENSFVGITRAFAEVEDGVSRISDLFEKNDLSVLPKTTIKYQELIDGFEQVSSAFKKANMEMFNSDLPGYRIALRQELLAYYQEVADAIQSGNFDGRELGDISDEARKKLQSALDSAFNAIDTESGVRLVVDRIISEVNKDFPELKGAIGAGEMAFGDTDKVEEYADKIVAEMEKISRAREVLYPIDGGAPTDAEVLQTITQYGTEAGSAYKKAFDEVQKIRGQIVRLDEILKSESKSEADTVKSLKLQGDLEKALVNLEEKKAAAIASTGGYLISMEEGWQRLLEKLGYGPDSNKDIRQSKKAKEAKIKNFTELGNKILELQAKYAELGEEEQRLLSQEVLDVSVDVGVMPPDDYDLHTVEKWFEDNIYNNPIINEATKFQFRLKVAQENQREMKALSKSYIDLIKEMIGVGKEWGDMSEGVQESTKKLLSEQMGEINKLDVMRFLGIELYLPDTFTPEQIRLWIAAMQAKFLEASNGTISPLSPKEEIDMELTLLKWQQELDKAGKEASKNRSREIRQSLKSLILDLRKAKKEFNDLNDEGDELLNKKLNLLAKEAGVLKKSENIDFNKMNEDALSSWMETLVGKLDEGDVIDIRLGWKKEDLANDIQRLSQEASDLWDKYDTSKKFEEWGLRMGGMDSSSIYNNIISIENELRSRNTESSIKAADDIRQKRLQILRREQEEAAKVIYESQKKAASETEQIYQKLYEDIATIKKGAEVDAGDGAIDSRMAEAGISSLTKKALRDITDAEWEAYKSTEMYAMAFGDLGVISNEVLQRLKADLESFKESGSLGPTDIRSVENAISKINKEMELGARNKEWFGTLVDGFKTISDAYGKYINDIPMYEGLVKIANDNYDEAKRLSDEAKASLESDPTDIAKREKAAEAESNLTIATLARAKAYEDLKDAYEDVSKSLDGADKKIMALNDAYGKIGQSISEVVGLVNEVADAFGLEFSDETNAILDGFGKGFALVGSAIAVATSATIGLVAAMMAFKVTAGAILWPLTAVGAALGTIVAIIKGNDKRLEKQVEAHKDAVEKLEKAYEDLEDRLQSVTSMTDAMSTYSGMMTNLTRQYNELAEAVDANNQRKQTEAVKDETEDLLEQMDEVQKKMKEANEQKLELLGAPTNYQDVANDWASSWLDSFKETGNGIDALKENFDSLYDDIVAGQLQSLVMGPALEKLKGLINTALDDFVVTDDEAAAIKRYRNEELAAISKRAEDLATLLGVTPGGFEGDTLKKGFEGVTEQTAQALESILNSTRYYVADNNRILQAIEQALTSEEGENTILSNMRAQTKYLKALSTIADAVYYSGSHRKGAGGIKVFVD